MNKTRNKNIFKAVFSVLLFSAILFCGVFALKGGNQNAYAASVTKLENIYNGDGKFNKAPLDTLAREVGYSGLSEMVKAAESGAIKNSEDFGDYSINFGSYTYNKRSREIAWLPMYLSKSDDGDAILTLWLSSVTSNTDDAQQELSAWSDGTYHAANDSTTKTFNGSEVYCDSYDGSYIRNYVLNGSTNYTTNWGDGTSHTQPDASKMKKFTQFTEGEFSSFIVTPSKVSWQMDECYFANDPKWDGNWEGATKANYPCDWVNDKIWLPSMYEVYARTIPANSVSGGTDDDVTGLWQSKDDGGLWYTSENEKCFSSGASYAIYLRSSYLHSSTYVHGYTYTLAQNTYGGYSFFCRAFTKCSVRPALHLNLSKVLDNVECDHEYGEWVVTKEPTCTTDGEKTRTCIYDSAHTEKEALPAGHDWVDQTVVEATCTTDGLQRRFCQRKDCTVAPQDYKIPATGHKYGEPLWTLSSDYFTATATFTCESCGDVQTLSKNNSWLCCTVKGNMSITWSIPFEGKKYTYTSEAKDVYLPHSGDKISTVTAPTCVDWGKDLYKCKVCSQEYELNVAALGHSFGNWEVTKKATYAEEGVRTRKCAFCNEVETQSIPTLSLHTNYIYIDLGDGIEYGEEIESNISAEYGEVKFTWYNAETGDELAETPVGVGLYKLVARVEENIEEGYKGVETEVIFEIIPRQIIVKIKLSNSGKSEDLEDLSAEVIEGTIIEGDVPYTLSTDADKTKVGEYEITGTCTDSNYEIVFVRNVYIVSKNLEDTSGGGKINLSADINVKFKITEDKTTDDSSELEGLSKVYLIQLLNLEEDDTLGDEFTDDIDCILTLKIPVSIILSIFGDEAVDKDKLVELLKVYYINDDGEYVPIEDYEPEEDEDGNWVIKFVYSGNFSTRIVFNNVKIVHKIVKDDSGNGEVDIPANIKIKLKIKQNETTSDYSELDGLKIGYYVYIWRQVTDGESDEEFTDSLDCILTLKIPFGIILSIFGDEVLDKDKLVEWLKVYYIGDNGEYVPIEDYEVEEDEYGNWLIKFAYSGKFRAHIVFNNVKIVHKIVKDDSGNGEVDIPANIRIKLKIENNETTSDYSELDGLKIGYYVYIWRQVIGSELDYEFTDSMTCTLTLKIPVNILLSIFGDEAVDKDKLVEWLKVYYINDDGEYVPIEDYEAEEDEDGNWVIKFEYSGKFRAHIVFNSVKIVHKIITDDSGLGKVDLSVNIKVKLQIKQNTTDYDYSKLKGIKIGYLIYLKNQDETEDDEFNGNISSTITLKIPVEIILTICGDGEVDKDKLVLWLKLYFVNVNGEYIAIDDFEIDQDDGGEWIIIFRHNRGFRAHIVFNNTHIVYKIVKDESGLGEISLPIHLTVKVKITENKAENDYKGLQGVKIGYIIRIWNQGEGDTPEDIFTDKVDCTITLRIPIEIIISIFGDGEVDDATIIARLKIYLRIHYLKTDGSYVLIEGFDIDKDDDGYWIIKFNHDKGFSTHIVFNSIYILSQKVIDTNGNGAIYLPSNMNVVLKITQNQTSNAYLELEGQKIGYYIHIWYRNGDSLGDEVNDSINSVLTLKIPINIIIAICGDEIAREKVILKLKTYLKIYYINGDGEYVPIEDSEIEQDGEGAYTVSFKYSKKFQAEIVFNTTETKTTTSGQIAGGTVDSNENSDSDGNGLIIGLSVAAAAVILIVLAITISIKRANGGNGSSSEAAVYRSVTRREQQKINRKIRMERKYLDVSDEDEDDEE